MKLGIIAENIVERALLALRIFPPGLFESWFGIMLARSVMAATKLGIFEALADGPMTANEVAARCQTHPRATEKLLNALVGAGCVHVKDQRYRIVSSVRRWLLKGSKTSFRDQVLLHYLEWHWWEHCEDYVRTGQPLRVHQTMSNDAWGVYQRGMRSGIDLPAKWVARNLPLSREARDMLDIGGSHGYWSVAICKRYPNLRASILELPQAIAHAAPLLEQEGMGDRIMYREGDALSADLGTGTYDLVFMSAIAHHFNAEQNRELMIRIAQALRPNGIVAIWEPLRQDSSGRIRQFGALLDLFFGIFSEAGTWSARDIASWFRDAGLVANRPKRMWMGPDLALHVARRLTS